jgi:Ca-activated chloride channel family protein
LSHSSVLPGSQELFADIRLVADSSSQASERAPLAMTVVLDTSGSMQGEKIERAKESCLELLRDMRDNDEISFVRYSDTAELIQRLARVGSVRSWLAGRIRSLQADGGTNIPRGLAAGLETLRAASRDRVERLVLVSDGLDGSRAEAERMASGSFEHGVSISSLGIGLDFDESYMGGVARAGHGNFAFVQDASTLASFLRRELEETAHTTVENTTVHLKLPAGVRLVRATGADARGEDSSVDLKIGSMYAGEERRVLVELATNLRDGETRDVEGDVAWLRVGGGSGEARIPRVVVMGSNDRTRVENGRDGAVLARAASVAASERQLQAAQAYVRGDTAGAQNLIRLNLSNLRGAASAAPKDMAQLLHQQEQSYEATQRVFTSSPPTSTTGKAQAKAATVSNMNNAVTVHTY